MSGGLLEFMRVQTRPNLVFQGPGGKKGETGPVTPVRAASERLVTWDNGPDEVLAATSFPLPVADIEDIPRSRRLQTLIRSAAGFQRHEVMHAFNAHRSIPSAQSKYPTELFVGVGETAWHYDSSWDGLRLVGAAAVGDPESDPWAAVDAGAPVYLAVLGRPNRLPSYYRELQWALTLCEEGHLAGMAAALARTLGFGAEVIARFDDQGLLERLGALPGDVWLPGAIIGLDGCRPRFPRGVGEWPEPAESWLAADRQAWLAESGSELDPVPGPYPGPGPDPDLGPGPGPDTELAPVSAPAVVTTEPEPSPRSWSSVMFDRSGGRAPGGLTASPEPLSEGLLEAALTAATVAASDWPVLPSGADFAGVELFAVVERTLGVEDGIYRWDPTRRALELRQTGKHLAGVQRAFYYPQTVTRVDTCNVALCFATDYTAALASEGPRGLRLAQLRFGALTQASAMVCSARDVFLRPCRSFDPDALGALLGLRSGLTAGYLCLVGRSRFTDLMLDLRP